MPFKYIGRITDFKGKPLWEIVGNLKNFGVGRIVVRNMFERYPEPCYLKILKVKPLPNPLNPSIDVVRKVEVLVENVFRGKRDPEPLLMCDITYKADFKLIPKDEEAAYCKCDIKTNQKIYPKTMTFPPLLKELILKEMKAKGEDIKEEPKLEIIYNKTIKHKIAEGNEVPDVEIVCGLGTPVSPNLYKDIKLE